MGYMASRRSAGGGTLHHAILLLPRPGRGTARGVSLNLTTGPGDSGEPVVTIMMPDEGPRR